MPATVVDGVTAAMDIYADESFGPVVAIIHARDAEHAVALANDSQYGLAAVNAGSKLAHLAGVKLAHLSDEQARSRGVFP